jgi:hypothetical protein
MQVERKPYELLVRWDTDGNLLGAHVQWSNVVTNDDGSKQIYPITVEPVALGDLFLQRVGAMLRMRGTSSLHRALPPPRALFAHLLTYRGKLGRPRSLVPAVPGAFVSRL